MPETLIEARDLTLAHGSRAAIRQVDFAITRSEIVTLVGPNGSGKSTLVKGLIGALPATSGTVSRADGLNIGYVPQNLQFDSFFPLTVRDFLCLPQRQSKADIAAALSNAGVPGLERRQLSALSGGQLQRVMLARALMMRPDILILDEPTQGLDQPGAAAFYQQIAHVRDDLGCAVLMVSHDLHVVMAASDRVLCLNGYICCQGAPEVVQSAPEYRALFGDGSAGAFALYRHAYDHAHEPNGHA
ncbi:MAG: metal ABC transporter ATP-binding protein [Pseudomonadota bacterium]